MLYVIYAAAVALMAALGADDWREAVVAMCYFAIGSIALYVSKGAR